LWGGPRLTQLEGVWGPGSIPDQQQISCRPSKTSSGSKTYNRTWLIFTKQQLGKLTVPDDIESLVEELGFSALAMSLFHGQQAGALPMHHRDPFDRMLIAQAQAEGLQILTKDGHFPAYGVRLINALK